MNNLKNMLRWEMILLSRYKIIHISILSVLLYFLTTQAVESLKDQTQVHSVLLFFDPAVIGLMFVGALVLFEKSEKAHDVDRIVRIGTHTGQDNLKSRLKEHFINEVKDRSIFRKNIGRCLLRNDPFLQDWELTPLITEVRLKNPNIDFTTAVPHEPS